MPPKPDPRISEPAAGYAEILEPAAKISADSSVAASFEEFAELDDEAAEMEIAPLNPAVKQTAKRILTALVQEFPQYYMVAPDDGGEVTIQTNSSLGESGSILIVCDEDGVTCFVTTDGKSRHAHYNQAAAEDLPDEFIRSALRELR